MRHRFQAKGTGGISISTDKSRGPLSGLQLLRAFARRRGLEEAQDRSVSQVGQVLLEPEHAPIIDIGIAIVMIMGVRMPSIVVFNDFEPALVDVKMNVTLFKITCVRRPYAGFRKPPLYLTPSL